MLENASRTDVASLGEFGLIKHLTQHFKTENNSTLKGVGDDCAVIDAGENCKVVTTDLLIEGVHFDLTYVPLKHLGYKAVVVNLSDVYAMNATPEQITVSVAMSNRFSLEAVEELYAGIKAACDEYNVDLVGGDTSSSVLGLMISITAIGVAKKEKLAYRNGAKETDLICVSGDLGAAYMGLQILEREKQIFKENKDIQPDLEGNDYILERQLKPEARRDIVALMAKHNIVPTSMIDVSDGLASELFHICTQSNVGCRIYDNKIPIDTETFTRAEDFNLEPLTIALNGGEDYELLFTVKQADFEVINQWKEITVIGHITEKAEGLNLVTQAGSFIELKARGWDAFAK